MTEQTREACGMVELDSKLRCDQIETVIALVQANMGIAVVPDLATRGKAGREVVFRSFQSPVPRRAIDLVTLANKELGESAEALVSSLVEAFAPKL